MHIGNVLSVSSTFPQPPFTVKTLGPGGVDPKILGSGQQMPPGITFEPAECDKYAKGQILPPELKGNMAAVIAEGEGDRYIAIALDTSEAVTLDTAMMDKCRHVTFKVASMDGTVDIIESPQFEGAQTLATRRVLSANVGGNTRSGEIYTFVAYLGKSLVMVTGNQAATANQQLAPVNLDRTKKLFTDSVAAVRS